LVPAVPERQFRKSLKAGQRKWNKLVPGVVSAEEPGHGVVSAGEPVSDEVAEKVQDVEPGPDEAHTLVPDQAVAEAADQTDRCSCQL
jgi:hypothetical protein